ncbi:MAG: response regulator transcription factor [Chloroflexi bacterium]|nr:response regulator transcription factor [Chloroflexota bacterium]MBI4507602.1 response regulator transcription factor [Chloroflexota bacterium]
MVVVEDDPTVRLSVRLACQKEGFAVAEAASGEDALAAVAARAPALVLLDLMLPGMSGFDVCRELRARDRDLPVIMLTARGDEVDKVVGLELGADDYVTKPFSPRELIARIRAVLRRAHRQPEDAAGDEFRAGGLIVHVAAREVLLDGRPVPLTRTEFDLLARLIEQPGRVVTRDQLAARVWGYESEGDTRLLDSHIGHLRAKIEPDPSNPRYVLTVRQVGYRFHG